MCTDLSALPRGIACRAGPSRRRAGPCIYTGVVLNLTDEQAAALGDRLQTESIVWITTVTADGQPQSSPVWFLWADGNMLVYAQPRSWKVRNIQANPRVSLHLNSDDAGGQIATFEGTAVVSESSRPVNEDEAYLD